jgi:hypothetical protein
LRAAREASLSGRLEREGCGVSNDGTERAADAAPVRRRLAWAGSKTVGRVTEIAVLTPIRKGCPPGERQTYEERMRAAIANIAQRHREGIPTELNRIPSIHFGRIIILRPEQYLVGSEAPGVDYYEPGETRAGGQDGTDRGTAAAVQGVGPPPQDHRSMTSRRQGRPPERRRRRPASTRGP